MIAHVVPHGMRLYPRASVRKGSDGRWRVDIITSASYEAAARTRPAYGSVWQDRATAQRVAERWAVGRQQTHGHVYRVVAEPIKI